VPTTRRNSESVTRPESFALLRNVRAFVVRNRRSEAPEGPRQGLTPARPAKSQVVFFLHPYYPVEERLGAKLMIQPLTAAAIGAGFSRYPGASKGLYPQIPSSNIKRSLPTNFAEYLESVGGDAGFNA